MKTALNAVLPPFVRRWVDRVEASPLGARLARGFFWSLVGTIVSKGLTLLSLILVARILGKQEFGQLGIVQSTAGMFQVVAGGGLGLTATKYIAEYRYKDPAKAGRILALSNLVALGTGAVAAAVLVAFAPWLADRVLAAPELAGLLRLGGLLVLLQALTGAQLGALTGLEAFRPIAWVNFVTGIASFPLIVLSAWWGDLEGAVWGLAGSLALGGVLNQLALWKHAQAAGIPLLLGGWGQELPLLFAFSLPASLSACLVTPVNWICNAILVNQPDGYAEMGIFNAANQWSSLILFLPGMLGLAAFPMMASIQAEPESGKYRWFLWSNVFASGGAGLAVALPVILLAPWIVALYGPGFESGASALTLIACAAVIGAGLHLMGLVNASEGRMWLWLLLTIVWAATLLSVFWCYGCKHGATGLAMATFVAHAVQAALFIAIRIAIAGLSHPRTHWQSI